MKKIVSITLAVLLLIGIIPLSANAADKTSITVGITVFNKGEFCKDKNGQVMWNKPVTVYDINADNKYSLDEALAAAHEQYYTYGIKGYETYFNEYYQSTSIATLWGQDAACSGYYRNNQITNAADQEFLSDSDQITAFIYSDTITWSDRYSYFTEASKVVNVGEEFSLTLQYSGYDSSWMPAEKPVAAAPIGVYDMADGTFGIPDKTVMKGEHIFGDYYASAATGTDGTVKMSFLKTGIYYVAPQYNSDTYSTYDDYMGSVPNYLVPAVCVVSVIDDAVKTNAEAAEKKINNIGTVTLNSGSKITQARTAYDKLTRLEKTVVGNYAVLIQAEETYSALLVSDAITKINAIGTVTLNSNKALAAANKAYNKLTDDQKAQVTNSDTLAAAQNAFYAIINESAKNIDANTQSYILSAYPEAKFGAEWLILGLARNNVSVPKDYYKNYYNAVEKYISENILDGDLIHRTKSSENTRLIVALAAIGKDPANVGGHNLLSAIADCDYVKKQGINGPIWALIALDTYGFEIPNAADGATQTTRENLINYILEKELANGGWALSGTAADPDTTGMVLCALAPYVKSGEQVKAAVDRAIATLSAIQLEDGGFASWGLVTSESCAQVVLGLSSVGIDVKTDRRFIKNGRSAYDALMTYLVETGGFRHTLDGNVNAMATYQAYMAIAAYNRFENNQTAFYDMSDTLKAANDQKSADAVSEKIAAIGKVSVESKSAIEAARSAYNALTAEQKALVTNYADLKSAEAALSALTAQNTSEQDDKNNKNDKTDKTEQIDNSSAEAPKTGEDTVLSYVFSLMLISAAAVSVLNRKRKTEDAKHC